MSARTDLATALAAALPSGWAIHPYPVEPDTVTRPTVVVYQTDLAPHQLHADLYLVELVAYLLAAADAPAAVEAELEAGLELLIPALEAFPAIHWTKGERVEMGNRPAYKIDLQTAYQKET